MLQPDTLKRSQGLLARAGFGLTVDDGNTSGGGGVVVVVVLVVVVLIVVLPTVLILVVGGVVEVVVVEGGVVIRVVDTTATGLPEAGEDWGKDEVLNTVDGLYMVGAGVATDIVVEDVEDGGGEGARDEEIEDGDDDGTKETVEGTKE